MSLFYFGSGSSLSIGKLWLSVFFDWSQGAIFGMSFSESVWSLAWLFQYFYFRLALFALRFFRVTETIFRRSAGTTSSRYSWGSETKLGSHSHCDQGSNSACRDALQRPRGTTHSAARCLPLAGSEAWPDLSVHFGTTGTGLCQKYWQGRRC